MPHPRLPAPAPGEVLLVCTSYEDGKARWGGALTALGGRREGDTVTLDGGVRLRLAEHPGWDYLHGGDFPALAAADGPAPQVIVHADIPVVFGGDDPLVVDMRDVPGRGVRVAANDLGRVLADLASGALRFDELVQGMDRCGRYRGDGGAPETPTPTAVVRTSFPRLPAGGGTILVRTDFLDDAGWRALLGALPDPEPDGEPEDGEYGDHVDLDPVVVDDPAYADLQPGQVPALVPPGRSPDGHTTMVALADAEALADPARPLLVVDLYDTPGQVARVPLDEAGSMAANLEIANMDFADFV
ncbi:hypothetical protein ABT299_12150 [Spirillospora sp. NPDC000708]